MTNEDIDRIPFREGDPPPGNTHVVAKMVDDDGNDAGLYWVDAKDLKAGPIVRRDLEGFDSLVRWTWRHLNRHIAWCRTFEDWELTFLREQNLASEVGIWVRATYAYLEFIHRNPKDADREFVFAAVSAVMGGREDLVKPKSVARKLKKLMSRLPKCLRDIENFTMEGRLKTGPRHLR